MADPLHVEIIDDTGEAHVDPETGDITVPQGDGGVVVHLDAARPQKHGDEDPFYANLAMKLGADKLGVIANELYEAIEADDKSRQGSLEIYKKGLDLLGIQLSEPRAAVDTASGAEGMSSVVNPLLLEHTLKGWANAEAELLPAAGPVKVKDDGDETIDRDQLAEAFERGMNHYLTVTAPEYYPDTSHMLLWGTHLRGSGFKKVYRCPLRRRPVSESVGAEDLIVSDTMKDLRSCARITHQIKMRPSVMKRMIRAKAYRDVTLTQPSPTTNQVEEKIASIQKTAAAQQRPEDQSYTIWETQCELDLPEFAPRDFKDEGIPLPYLVTMDKDSREILSIRRDWDEDDDQAQRIRMYVRYPYVPGPGFYGTGLLNILGNCSAAMTAAWRIALDCGMFANFPGGLVSKDATRQNSNIQRVGPGEYAPVETGGKPIEQVVMGLPYKDVSPGMLALMDKIKAQADAAGQAPAIPTGEGLANVPVGTMLAAVEQATKVMAAAFKGMHVAQSEEIQLLVDLFRMHPEDFWRNNKDQPDYWDEQKLMQAISDYNLVPVSDPNVPSHIHRVAKAVALSQIIALPGMAPKFDLDEAARRMLHAIKEDPRGLLIPPEAQQAMSASAPPDPKMIKAQADVKTAEARTMTAQADAQLAQGKLAQLPQEQSLEEEKLQTQREVAAADVTKEHIIHDGDMVKAAHAAEMDRADHALKTVQTAHDISQDHHQRGMDVAQHGLDVGQAQHDAALGVAQHALDVHEVLHPPKPAKPQGGKK